MRGFAAIALCDPYYDGNIGGAIRAASVYGARLVVVGSKRPHRRGRIERTDPRKSHKHMPVVWSQDILQALPHESQAVAVEIDPRAVSLPDFQHPESAYYIFGPENGSVPNDLIGICDHVVSIPTAGCMNLAATVNVVLYDRLAKQERSS